MNEQEYVVEVCPHCSHENQFKWDVKTQGHHAFCANCGKRLMVCSECPLNGDNNTCTYNRETDTCTKQKGENK